ncbi:sensor histidine kinase [Pseudonocardia sp. GCM10023141]|uniref:sensor histidine kinase n=1 Tax=Pseudonocardia sp. GCM10023141 TaxID=3252653 RepID=UPI00360AF1FB
MHLYRRPHEWLIDAARLVAVALTAPVALLLLLVLVAGVVLLPLFGLGVPVAAGALGAIRALIDLVGRVLGVELPRRYASDPAWTWSNVLAGLRDPQTARDLVWLVAQGALGFGVLAVAWGLQLVLEGFISPEQPFSILTIPVLVILVIIWFVVPWLVQGFALLARTVVAPTAATLEQRVEQLTESRAATVDAQAAELRRIERDLHDGAQARLAAVRMTLGLASQILRTDPDGAAALLTEARDDAGKALAELRDLVRGIHPPVLADRGLAGGLGAAALLCPVPVDVAVELPGRPQAPVESALYFAAAEALANIGKHADATRAWLRAEYIDGVLRVVVGDDGQGGADARGGTGLRGIERRLAAFDGTLRVSSPVGGPTELTMELPCVVVPHTVPEPARPAPVPAAPSG